jgi:nucleoside-diphosphate-sugar epimerase
MDLRGKGRGALSVVVTGAAGFVGAALVGELLAAGFAVTTVDRRPVVALPAGATALRADLLDGDAAVRDALRTAEAVFHLAGHPGVREHGRRADRQRRRDNVLATARVLRDVPPGTPLVVTSSASVYGGGRGRASRESDRLAPRGGYARSKVAVERLCAHRLARGGAVAVARPFTVVGERQRPDMALALWAAAARRGDPIRIFGSPRRTRDVTDVREVARALHLMAVRAVRGPLNIGTGRPRTLGELAEAVRRAAGPAPIEVVPADRADPAATHADPRLAHRRLGFTPRTDLDDVVRRALALAPTP